MRSLFLLPFLVSLLFIAEATHAQVVSGPMVGQVELRTARIWVEVQPGSKATLWYWKKGEPATAKYLAATTDASAWYTPVVFDVVALEPNTTYEYAVAVNRADKKPAVADGSFTTQELWQHRKPAPDFSFITGSCAYFNEPPYDRPGTPYGKDSSIFETMAKEKAAFMLWLGDNWYLREADFYSAWGVWYRAHRDRALPVLQPLLKAMPHYAIWDDHDYGPNNADKSFVFRETARQVFMSYWANPSYGQDNEGIYTRFQHGDAEFFLLDDRYFRSNDDMAPYVNGQPNPEKRMWGKKQLDWLKNGLLQSRATFKFIVTGSQVLNPASPYDCLQSYPVEYNELMSFLMDQRINGVLFLTGDRHHSEVIRLDRTRGYTLYDITSSPLTSGVGKVSGREKDNAARVRGTLVEQQNYTRLSISGERGARKLLVEFLGLKGELLASWTVNEKELKMP